jgi:single-strand DNA-binding protein
MSNGVNKATLIGNLGNDPEVRFAQSGNAVCNLRLAISERRKSGDEWKEVTEWVDVVVFGKTAENAGTYLRKGKQVYVEGRIQTRSFEAKDGTTKYRTEVVADRIVFLGGKGDDKEAPAKTSGEPSSNGGASIDDEIPF